jgi:hypothetical protein
MLNVITQLLLSGLLRVGQLRSINSKNQFFMIKIDNNLVIFISLKHYLGQLFELFVKMLNLST